MTESDLRQRMAPDKTHRSRETPIGFVVDHELGPYKCILAGFIPPLEWRAREIPLDELRRDVEDQLTLLLAGEEYLRTHLLKCILGREPLYGDVLGRLTEITKYRDENREKFKAKLQETVAKIGKP